MKVLKTHKCFNGQVRFWEHDSKITQTKMKFSTFTPPGELKGALIWLSGLTCTDENFMTKAGAQRALAKHQLMVICPDTSPRGLQLPAEHDSYDFGSGAGFYVNATSEGYKDHYRMYDYISQEIYDFVRKDFSAGDRIGIFGHSMGGHGALVLGLREPGKFKSASAFSPIVNPSQVPWGQKAFRGYFGENQAAWKDYDATELVMSGHVHPKPILIDQGLDDEFLETQLRPEIFDLACKSGKKQELMLRKQAGYDHSYYFIASFIQDHIDFHSQKLLAD